jgi:hypothetical protein
MGLYKGLLTGIVPYNTYIPYGNSFTILAGTPATTEKLLKTKVPGNPIMPHRINKFATFIGKKDQILFALVHN